MKLSLAVMVLVALLTASVGQAANPPPGLLAAAPTSLSAGKSFLDHASMNYAEEPSYSVPATFPGPLVAAPRSEPDTRWMLLACFGLLLYLGRRRGKALGAAF